MPGSSKPHGRSREPASRSTQISKKLSWLLRHGAEKENLALGPGGYANLADVLANRNLRSLKVTFDEVRALVADNDKQRYQLILFSDLAHRDDPNFLESTLPGPEVRYSHPPSNPALWLIRATQGHSLKLQDEADSSHSLLTPLSLSKPDALPRVAVHGTNRRAWPLIQASGGLKPMKRNHVHFATGVPEGFTSLASAAVPSQQQQQQQQDATDESTETALPVISGMRNSSTILIFLDLRKALEAGIGFGMSANGVILTEGNAEGLVPVEFFERVEDWRCSAVQKALDERIGLLFRWCGKGSRFLHRYLFHDAEHRASENGPTEATYTARFLAQRLHELLCKLRNYAPNVNNRGRISRCISTMTPPGRFFIQLFDSHISSGIYCGSDQSTCSVTAGESPLAYESLRRNLNRGGGG
nr:trna 2'-phosphotransferase 1 [Quercus suber]